MNDKNAPPLDGGAPVVLEITVVDDGPMSCAYVTRADDVTAEPGETLPLACVQTYLLESSDAARDAFVRLLELAGECEREKLRRLRDEPLGSPPVGDMPKH